jgi:hypothetical protein
MARLPFHLKSLSVIALLCITVWMGCAAVADLCPQVHGANDYCPVCHLNLLPFLRMSVPVVGAPALLIERLAPHPDWDHDGSDYRAPGTSRAPPLSPKTLF